MSTKKQLQVNGLQPAEPAPAPAPGRIDGPEDEDEPPSSPTRSLYEEALQDELYYTNDPASEDMCSALEGRMYREILRTVGIPEFVKRFVDSGEVSAKKLLSAFQVRPPYWLEGQEDTKYYKLLGYAITRELCRRDRILEYNCLDDAAELLKKCRNIMVITGAGISTNLGIPDFRSKTSGLYSQLREAGMESPEDLFTLEVFDQDPSLFYNHAAPLLPDLHKWTPTHQFIRLLQDKKKLRRNYTQNIDNVETQAGILPDKLVQCHGSWATFSCRKCGYTVPGKDLFESVRQKVMVKCSACATEAVRTSKKRKRSKKSTKKRKRGMYDAETDSDGDDRFDIPTPGIMKPDITFFGESLPARFFDIMNEQDRAETDLVIVIGTSMKVNPVSEIPHYLPSTVPQIFISRDPCHHINFDITLLGDCDVIVAELCRRAGWKLEHEMMPSKMAAVEVLDHEQFPSTQYVRSVQEST